MMTWFNDFDSYINFQELIKNKVAELKNFKGKVNFDLEGDTDCLKVLGLQILTGFKKGF